jgi:competence protein ComEC
MRSVFDRAPFAAITPALATGIAAAECLTLYSVTLVAVAILALLGAALSALDRNRPGAAAGLALLALTGAGTALGLAARDARPPTDLDLFAARNNWFGAGPMMFEGCVADRPVLRDDELVATVEMRAVGNGPRWIPVSGTVQLRVNGAGAGPADAPALPEPGDRIRSWAQWSPFRNFGNPGSQDRVSALRRRGILLAGRVRSPRLIEIIPGGCAGRFENALESVRRNARFGFARLARQGRVRDASILSSVTLGDYADLDRPTRDAFQNSGTFHVLVVSGLHVGWIAAAAVFLLRRMKVPRAARTAVAGTAVLCYCALVGFQASITRALWMFLVYMLGQFLFRRATPSNIALASAFTLLLIRPQWLFDAGFQLSFLAVLAIAVTAAPALDGMLRPALLPLGDAGARERVSTGTGAASRFGRRLRFRAELAAEAIGDRWHPRAEAVALAVARAVSRLAVVVGGMVVVSVSVQLWLEPLLAAHFNRLSWVAPLANILIVPLSSLTLACGVFACALSHVPAAADAALNLAAWSANLLFTAAARTAGIGFAWQRCPTPGTAWVLLCIALLFAWWAFGWKARILSPAPAVLLIACLWGLPASARLPAGLGNANRAWCGLSTRRPALSLTFLDVGQGDSACIRFPGGRTWLVDAGGIRETSARSDAVPVFDVGEAVVSRYLWWVWIRGLDRVVLTHAHQDHAGGIPAVLRNFPTDGFSFAESPGDEALARVLAESERLSVPSTEAASGTEWIVDGVSVAVLHPPRDGVRRAANDCSVVVRLRYGRFRGLLTGDIERASEAGILAREVDLGSTLLKVAHHGGRTSSMDGFLDAVRPRWGVVSAGRNNPFGHPAREAVMRMLRHGIRPLLTADHGAVHFETDGDEFALESHRCGAIASGRLARNPR